MDMLAVGASDQSVDLLCEIGPVVHHRHDDAFRPQLGIDLSLNSLYRIKKINETLCRQVLRLDWDDDVIGSRECVQVQHTEGRGAVNQNVIILLAQRGENLLEDITCLARIGGYSLC